MTFITMLDEAQRRNRSMLCVGLDPEPARFPEGMRGDASKIYDFCARIVDATADLVVAFKPQIAYFAAHPIGAKRTRSSARDCGKQPPSRAFLQTPGYSLIGPRKTWRWS